SFTGGGDVFPALQRVGQFHPWWRRGQGPGPREDREQAPDPESRSEGGAGGLQGLDQRKRAPAPPVQPQPAAHPRALALRRRPSGYGGAARPYMSTAPASRAGTSGLA